MADTFEQAVALIQEQIDEGYPPWKSSPPERLYGFARAVAKWQASRDAEILKTESNRLTELGTYSDDAEYVMSLSVAILKAAEEM